MLRSEIANALRLLLEGHGIAINQKAVEAAADRITDAIYEELREANEED